MTIMQIGALVWLLTALGGVTMLWTRIAGKPRPPGWLSLAHGTGALVGLALVAWSAMFIAEAQNLWQNMALGFGVLAAAGGFTLLLGFHMRGRTLPLPIMIVHGMLGLVAVAFALLAGFADLSLGGVDPAPPNVPVSEQTAKQRAHHQQEHTHSPHRQPDVDGVLAGELEYFFDQVHHA
ncbi:MAG: hypothetical protein WD294_13050 [Phycisphaeraceae bacterium]